MLMFQANIIYDFILCLYSFFPCFGEKEMVSDLGKISLDSAGDATSVKILQTIVFHVGIWNAEDTGSALELSGLTFAKDIGGHRVPRGDLGRCEHGKRFRSSPSSPSDIQLR